eukprot:TRINITY_DN68153_c6_g3_i1.p1 TRINITY_DN68153_c6_g3~~TRINITY_DN68153_c6_g3_i1.p1  ORF type:complete len:602 (+),score=47.16 TRINITY_DN68153_c6_g3_i1:85-1890(+)
MFGSKLQQEQQLQLAALNNSKDTRSWFFRSPLETHQPLAASTHYTNISHTKKNLVRPSTSCYTPPPVKQSRQGKRQRALLEELAESQRTDPVRTKMMVDGLVSHFVDRQRARTPDARISPSELSVRITDRVAKQRRSYHQRQQALATTPAKGHGHNAAGLGNNLLFGSPNSGGPDHGRQRLSRAATSHGHHGRHNSTAAGRLSTAQGRLGMNLSNAKSTKNLKAFARRAQVATESSTEASSQDTSAATSVEASEVASSSSSEVEEDKPDQAEEDAPAAKYGEQPPGFDASWVTTGTVGTSGSGASQPQIQIQQQSSLGSAAPPPAPGQQTAPNGKPNAGNLNSGAPLPSQPSTTLGTVLERRSSGIPPAVNRKGLHTSFMDGDHNEKKLPYTDGEIRKLKAVFDQFDADGGGTLSIKELEEYGRRVGVKVNHKRMDKDRSGHVTFLEFLRAIYPKVSQTELRMVIKRIEPKKRVTVAQAVAKADWREKFDRKALEELTEIYRLYQAQAEHSRQSSAASSVDPNAERDPSQWKGVTIRQIQRSIGSNAVLTPTILAELFNMHDLDTDGELSLEEFATLMQDSYVKNAKSNHPTVRLYFQKKK